MKKAFSTRILLPLAFLCPGLSAAQPAGFTPVDPAGEVVHQISEASAGIRTIHSHFVQEKQLRYLDETIISRGEFWFKRENNLRWAYEEPYRYAIIIREGTFRIIDGQQVSEYDIESNPVFKGINDIILGMVGGDILKEDLFSIRVYEDPTRYLVMLEPLDPDIREVIPGMEVFFDRNSLWLSEIVMRETEDDFTEITFTDRNINETIPDSVFLAGG